MEPTHHSIEKRVPLSSPQRKYTVEEMIGMIKPLKKGSKERGEKIKALIESGKSPLSKSRLYEKLRIAESMNVISKEEISKEEVRICKKNRYQSALRKNRTGDKKARTARDTLRSRARITGHHSSQLKEKKNKPHSLGEQIE